MSHTEFTECLRRQAIAAIQSGNEEQALNNLTFLAVTGEAEINWMAAAAAAEMRSDWKGVRYALQQLEQ